MIRRLRGPASVVAICAVAVLAAVGRGDTVRRSPAVGVPRVERGRLRAAGPRRAITGRDALLVARRFAAAYAAWDAGRRDRRTSRRLARATTPALFAELDRLVARPVAGRPRRFALRPAGVYATDGGSFLVPLLARGGVHIVTLVVVRSPAGARIAHLLR
jgi:hypothetical protein